MLTPLRLNLLTFGTFMLVVGWLIDSLRMNWHDGRGHAGPGAGPPGPWFSPPRVRPPGPIRVNPSRRP